MRFFSHSAFVKPLLDGRARQGLLMFFALAATALAPCLLRSTRWGSCMVRWRVTWRNQPWTSV